MERETPIRDMPLDELHDLVFSLLSPGVDISADPVGKKHVLWTRGAQKLCYELNYKVLVGKAHYWNNDHMMLCHVVVSLLDEDHMTLGSGIGAASSRESLFRQNDKGVITFKDDGPNSMIKMASNRALVAAVITTTAMGHRLTQDVFPERKVDQSEMPPAPKAPEPEDVQRELPLRTETKEGWDDDHIVEEQSKRKELHDWSEDPVLADMVKEVLGDVPWARATKGMYRQIADRVIETRREALLASTRETAQNYGDND